jgi:hypothetical protein
VCWLPHAPVFSAKMVKHNTTPLNGMREYQAFHS